MERRHSGYFKVGPNKYLSYLAHYPGDGQTILVGAKPKSPTSDTPVDQTETASPDDSIETKNEIEDKGISQGDTDQHTSKVDVVLRRPLSTQDGPDEKKLKTDDETSSTQDDEYIHLDVEAEKVDPCKPTENSEPSTENVDLITEDVVTNTTEVLQESSYYHAEDSCKLESDDSHSKSDIPESINDASCESDFYVVDVQNNDGPNVEASVSETVFITDVIPEQHSADIFPHEETHAIEASLVREPMAIDVHISDDITPLDSNDMHEAEHVNDLDKDSTDILKEQIFNLISNIDTAEQAQKASVSSKESEHEKTDHTISLTESSTHNTVIIDINTTTDNNPGTANNDIVHCSNNNTIDDNSMSNELDRTNPFQNNSDNISDDLTLPRINITYNQIEGDENNKTQETGEHKAHHRYSRECPVRYTEILKEDLVEIEHKEKETTLTISNECLDEPEIIVKTEVDNMSEPITLDVLVDAEHDSTKEDVSVVADTDDAAVSIDAGGSRTERKHAVLTDHKDMLSNDNKRYERSTSLNEQRRQFILGENRSHSVDKPSVSSVDIDEEITVKNEEENVVEDIIIPSVVTDAKESPDDVINLSPEHAAKNTDTEIVNQNGTLAAETSAETPVTEQTIESNETVAPGLDINKNPESESDLNDKKDKLPNDTEIQNGNSENIGEEEPGKSKKRKKKGKQTCKCSLM